MKVFQPVAATRPRLCEHSSRRIGHDHMADGGVPILDCQSQISGAPPGQIQQRAGLAGQLSQRLTHGGGFPQPMHAEAHQIVHQVIARGGDPVEEVIDLTLALALGHLTVPPESLAQLVQTGGARRSFCVHWPSSASSISPRIQRPVIQAKGMPRITPPMIASEVDRTRRPMT